jgi:glycosyltransferase involved in cell wall biosynthesis
MKFAWGLVPFTEVTLPKIEMSHTNSPDSSSPDGCPDREPLQILYHHRIVAADGMRVHVNAIVAALRAGGHEVQIVGPEASNLPGNDLTTRIAGLRKRMPAWLGELLEVAYNIPAYRRLSTAIRVQKPDVVYERYNLFLLAGVLAKRRWRVPLIMEVNAPLAAERMEYGGLSLKRLARLVEGMAWRRADAVLPVSQALAEHVRRSGVASDRIHVVANAVPRRTVMRPGTCAAEADNGLVTFGFVGFARPWHGLERVLDVLAKYADSPMRLLVVGDGPVLARLRSRARELGIASKLTFTGAIEHTEIPSRLAEVSIALQPDVTPYASPLKLFEYMAAGCAIIAPDRANIREILEHERTALLFDPGAPEGLARAVDRLATDSSLRRRLGRAAAARVVERDLTWEGNANRILDIARDLSPPAASSGRARKQSALRPAGDA